MLVLASGSEIRSALLRQAGLDIRINVPRIDEQGVKDALVEDGVAPRDIADALAEAKARKIASRHPTELVLGCDQVLDFGGELLSKPVSTDAARAQIKALAGHRHELHAAAVAYENGVPVWRHVATARLTMRPLSDTYIDSYVTRNWDSIRSAVGSYKLEEEGVRLFSAVEGDYHTVLGLPMLPLLSWLIARGTLQS